MKAGIVGLRMGKSTLLIASPTQKRKVPTFLCTIEPNVGVVNVPDERSPP